MKFNSLQFNSNNTDVSLNNLQMNILSINENYLEIKNKYIKKFKLKKQKTISFTKDGFFSLIMQLEGKIAVSMGESEAIIQGAILAKEYKKNIEFLNIRKDGTLDLSLLNDEFSYVFISSYIVDTFVKVNLLKVKSLCKSKIISNISSNLDFNNSNILLLDSYKLNGNGEYGVVLYNDELEDSYMSSISLITLELCLESISNIKKNINIKNKFLEYFQDIFKDDLFLFVNPKLCLENTLHIGLKDIKARELIRILALDNIFISNGEGCSLGLMQPSRIIQEMSYAQTQSRWCICMDFVDNFKDDEVQEIVKLINKRYRQIKALV
jgi:hypothetical protein